MDIYLGKDNMCVTADMTATHAAMKLLTENLKEHGHKVYIDIFFSLPDLFIDLTEKEMLVSCLTYSSALKMEAVHSSETLVDFHWSTWHNIPGDSTLHRLCLPLLPSFLHFLSFDPENAGRMFL
jgi:hypothetical protein